MYNYAKKNTESLKIPFTKKLSCTNIESVKKCHLVTNKKLPGS